MIYKSLLAVQFIFVIQWKPLNGITLGLRETDSNNQMMLIGKLASTYIRY